MSDLSWHPTTRSRHKSSTSDFGAGNGTRTTARYGRSGPRSRSGCVTCKNRRVRCDEAHPVCGHCTRLQLNCSYRAPTQRAGSKSSLSAARDNPATTSLIHQPVPSRPPSALRNVHSGFTTLSAASGGFPRDCSSPFDQGNIPLLQDSRNFNFNDLAVDLTTSWAGEFSCLFPEGDSLSGGSAGDDDGDAILNAYSPLEQTTGTGVSATTPTPNDFSVSRSPSNLLDSRVRPSSQAIGHLTPWPSQDMSPQSQEAHRVDSLVDPEEHSGRVKQMFQRIVQPPASILIGGIERWRHLQQYLCNTSEHSRAVNHALICVVELLTIDEISSPEGQTREDCMKRILDHHRLACAALRTKFSGRSELRPKTREQMLAAIFLLSWFEVIHDQEENRSLFPRDLAEMVIASHTSWNRYSRQLLAWLNTLDSKATHLGGEHLLSPKSLEAVSQYPMQITSSNGIAHGDNGGEILTEDDSDSGQSEPSRRSALSPAQARHHHHHDHRHQPQQNHLVQLDVRVLTLGGGQVKQTVMKTMLQPGLEWYLTSQSYCRRISSHDKHHRRRSTSDDEYEVIVACKQLEAELWELWESRPAVLSLTAEQLTRAVSADIATRVEEVQSVYMASFWILFVYLHRVSWWNWPHSRTTTRALAEAWRSLQRANGEVNSDTMKKVVHPALLWPLFMFGCECRDDAQRRWAIEQLEALGEAKPVLEEREQDYSASDLDALPPFRLSSGATRNAKRAAVLLTHLIKEQDKKKARVDDRDLSMKLFGCYFSIV